MIVTQSRFRRITNIEFFRNTFNYKVLPSPENISAALIFANCESLNCSVTPKLAFPYLFNLALKARF